MLNFSCSAKNALFAVPTKNTPPKGNSDYGISSWVDPGRFGGVAGATKRHRSLYRTPMADTSGPMPAPKACASCQADNLKLLRCFGCFSVVYCGKDHQKSHWKEHKSACNRFRTEMFTGVQIVEGAEDRVGIFIKAATEQLRKIELEELPVSEKARATFARQAGINAGFLSPIGSENPFGLKLTTSGMCSYCFLNAASGASCPHKATGQMPPIAEWQVKPFPGMEI